jgi:uncharacterized protein (DUF2147 family)
VKTSFRRVAPALIAVPALGGAVAACGTTTIDPKSGEDLIRNFAKQNGGTVKSVSCPSGVKPKDGTTFSCKVRIADSTTGAQRSGTITVHVTAGGKRVEILGAQDIHVT